MDRFWIGLRAVFYAILFLSMWTGAALIFRPLDQYIPLGISAALVVPGLALVLAGVALCLVTVGFFVFEGRGTPAVFDPPVKFVPHGPYRYIRNPMYVGYVTALVGLGLSLRSISIVLFAAGSFLTIHAFVVWAEEPGLRRRFGNQYDEYCRAVARWIPGFTR